MAAENTFITDVCAGDIFYHTLRKFRLFPAFEDYGFHSERELNDRQKEVSTLIMGAQVLVRGFFEKFFAHHSVLIAHDFISACVSFCRTLKEKWSTEDPFHRAFVASAMVMELYLYLVHHQSLRSGAIFFPGMLFLVFEQHLAHVLTPNGAFLPRDEDSLERMRHALPLMQACVHTLKRPYDSFNIKTLRKYSTEVYKLLVSSLVKAFDFPEGDDVVTVLIPVPRLKIVRVDKEDSEIPQTTQVSGTGDEGQGQQSSVQSLGQQKQQSPKEHLEQPQQQISVQYLGQAQQQISVQPLGQPQQQISVQSLGQPQQQISVQSFGLPQQQISVQHLGQPQQQISMQHLGQPQQQISVQPQGLPQQRILVQHIAQWQKQTLEQQASVVYLGQPQQQTSVVCLGQAQQQTSVVCLGQAHQQTTVVCLGQLQQQTLGQCPYHPQSQNIVLPPGQPQQGASELCSGHPQPQIPELCPGQPRQGTSGQCPNQSEQSPKKGKGTGKKRKQTQQSQVTKKHK